MRFLQLLSEKKPCDEGYDYVSKQLTAQEAWKNCVNPSWMLWALNRFYLVDDIKHRRFACWCAINTPLANGGIIWDLLTDERSRNAVIVAERFCNNRTTQQELNIARAWARDAARDAVYGVGGTAAATAALVAVYTTCTAVYATSEAATAASFGSHAAKAAQAQALRNIYGFPFAHLLQEA